MKKIKLLTVVFLLSTLFVGFNACSNDDEDDGKKDQLIVGKWKRMTEEGSVHTHLEFKSNGTFEYTSINENERDYEEHGEYRIENGKLYQMFSDEDEWIIYKIDELNSISLILRGHNSDGELDDYTINYQRVK